MSRRVPPDYYVTLEYDAPVAENEVVHPPPAPIHSSSAPLRGSRPQIGFNVLASKSTSSFFRRKNTTPHSKVSQVVVAACVDAEAPLVPPVPPMPPVPNAPVTQAVLKSSNGPRSPNVQFARSSDVIAVDPEIKKPSISNRGLFAKLHKAADILFGRRDSSHHHHPQSSHDEVTQPVRR